MICYFSHLNFSAMKKLLLSTLLALAACLGALAQCDYTEVVATVSTGEWGYEMSFTIIDEMEYEVGSFQGIDDFQEGDTTLCLMDGCYLLIAQDSWGDGWNGGSVSLDIDGDVIDYALEDGFLGFLTFGVNTVDCYFDIPGCTDSTALNYLPDATVDDGSCVNIIEFDDEGTTREYLYYEPEDIQSGAPLVFVLHGYGGGAWGMYDAGFNELADVHGFAVCYPYGLEDDFGIPHWNAGLNISEVDDLGFLVGLAGFLQSEHSLGADCTYSCGMSNGGYMSYHLACGANDTFKAIASVTGTMSAFDWEGCNPDNPIPVLEIHGTADDVVPYDATDPDGAGWYGAGGVEAVHNFWVNQNQCTEVDEFTFDDVVPEDNTTVDAKIHTGGINGNQVWLYSVIGGGHDWPGFSGNFDILATDEIWNFFSQVSTCSATSIDEPTPHFDVEIFPNPSNGNVTINSEITAQVQLWDVEGRLVESIRIQTGYNYIQNLDAGVYLARVVSENGLMIETVRLVVL